MLVFICEHEILLKEEGIQLTELVIWEILENTEP